MVVPDHAHTILLQDGKLSYGGGNRDAPIPVHNPEPTENVEFTDNPPDNNVRAYLSSSEGIEEMRTLVDTMNFVCSMFEQTQLGPNQDGDSESDGASSTWTWNDDWSDR